MKLDKKTLAYLKEKGVSAEILIGMLLEDDPQPAGGDPEPEAPAPEVQPAPAAPENPQADPVLAAIEKLTGAVQAMNIRGRSMDLPRAESADDILASVLSGRAPEGGK